VAALWFVLWFGAMALVMRWLQGTRLTARAGQGASMLQHPRSLLVIGLPLLEQTAAGKPPPIWM